MAGSTHFMGKCPAFFVSAAKRFLAFALLLFLGAGELSAQRRHGSSPLDTIGEEVSQADGLKILNTFRRLGVAGDYRLNFKLELRKHREKTVRYSGVLLGTQTEFGPLSRVDVALKPAEVTELGALVPAELKKLLLQNGIFANALESTDSSGEAGGYRLVESDRYFEGIAGSEITVFDLLMPFTFWQDFKYEGRVKQGRPLQVFSLYPPKDAAGVRERISRVELYLDDEFNALNRVKIFNADGELEKTISVLSFKIVDGQGLPSQIDVKNELTKDKALFRVIDAAVGLELPAWVFEAEGLERNVYGTELAQLQPAAEE